MYPTLERIKWHWVKSTFIRLFCKGISQFIWHRAVIIQAEICCFIKLRCQRTEYGANRWAVNWKGKSWEGRNHREKVFQSAYKFSSNPWLTFECTKKTLRSLVENNSWIFETAEQISQLLSTANEIKYSTWVSFYTLSDFHWN